MALTDSTRFNGRKPCGRIWPRSVSVHGHSLEISRADTAARSHRDTTRASVAALGDGPARAPGRTTTRTSSAARTHTTPDSDVSIHRAASSKRILGQRRAKFSATIDRNRQKRSSRCESTSSWVAVAAPADALNRQRLLRPSVRTKARLCPSFSAATATTHCTVPAISDRLSFGIRPSPLRDFSLGCAHGRHLEASELSEGYPRCAWMTDQCWP